MQKNYTQLLLGILIGLLAGLLIAKFIFPKTATVATNTPSNNSGYSKPNTNKNASREVSQQENGNSSGSIDGNTTIPDKVKEVLQYIKANNRAMDGYVGGRVFTNREKILPQQDDNGNRINYQEWDVNPKVEGKNRGTERICTGSDGRSWYTNDHYKSFTEIK